MIRIGRIRNRKDRAGGFTPRPKQLPVDPKLQFSRPPAPGAFLPSGPRAHAAHAVHAAHGAQGAFLFLGRPPLGRSGPVGARSLGRNSDELHKKTTPLDGRNRGRNHGRNQGRNQRLKTVPYIECYCAALYTPLLYVTLWHHSL